MAIIAPFSSCVFALETLERTQEEKALIEAVTAEAEDFSAPEKFENYPGGATSNQQIFTEEAFSQPLANLEFDDEVDFRVGNGLFRQIWQAAPSDEPNSDGLGPLFNASSCQSCHFKDGRGRLLVGENEERARLLRLGRANAAPSANEAVAGDPVYGHQFQDRAVEGVLGEGKITVTHEEKEVLLADGTAIRLQKPIFELVDLNYAKRDAETAISPRNAQQMIGLGLIEAIAEEDVLAHADPEYTNGYGISGRASQVWSSVHERFMLGRFGHQAAQATLKDQAASAFLNDMGLISRPFIGSAQNCSDAQPACLSALSGEEDGLEVSDEVLELVTFYSQNLAVPERKAFDDPKVLRGKAVFYEIGCQNCHVPKFVTRRFADANPLGDQLIWPYSDFLLHDMGEELAAGFGEWNASAREWRTAPLWGIGHTKRVSGETNFLHDGRARTILEAILWHGGEAQPHRDAVIGLAKSERDALIAFLESM